MTARRRDVAAVFDRAADTYEATGTPYFGPLAERLVELAALVPGARVLDLGTGRGGVLVAAASAVGPDGRVVGVDTSTRMAALTAADLRRRGLASAAVVVGDAARPPLDGVVDAVLGGMVAQFLPDPGAALRAWHDLAAPGAVLALSWWAHDDARFAPLDDVVARHTGVAVRRHRPRPFSGDVDATDTAVARSGWRLPQTRLERLDVRFRDVDAWWAWSWSHGQRRVWESVDDMGPVRGELGPVLHDLTEPDGSLRYRPTVAFTTARR